MNDKQLLQQLYKSLFLFLFLLADVNAYVTVVVNIANGHDLQSPGRQACRLELLERINRDGKTHPKWGGTTSRAE